MGKTITPTYRVEYRDQSGWHSECWSGRATTTRLEDWRVARNSSMQPGGVNEHVAPAIGYVPHISHAKLVHQKSGEVVATTVMPMFEAV